MAADALCVACRFWVKVRGEGVGVPGIPGQPPQGECRRHAPRPSVGTGHSHVIWPTTAATDGCGEFAAKG